MRIYLSPQFSDDSMVCTFSDTSFEINVTKGLLNYTDTFDFTEFPDGEISLEDEHGNELIETELPDNPIWSARKVGGVLYVKILHWVSIHEQRQHILFPDWIDSKDYQEWLEAEEWDYGKDDMEERE